MQPSALLHSQLSRKSSTVRFTTARPFTPDSEADPVDPPADPTADPTADTDTLPEDHAGHAALQPHDADVMMTNQGLLGKPLVTPMATLSSVTSLLKGVLKKTTSGASAATLMSCDSQVLQSSGISFALDADDDQSGHHGEYVGAVQHSVLLKQESELFPAWLVGGYVLSCSDCLCTRL